MGERHRHGVLPPGQLRRLLIGGRGPMREIASPADIHFILRYARRLWPALAIRHRGPTPGADSWPLRRIISRMLHAPRRESGFALAITAAVSHWRAMGRSSRKNCDPRIALDMPVTGIRPFALHACGRSESLRQSPAGVSGTTWASDPALVASASQF